MTQRDYQISFCKYCENRKFNSTKGLICNLTNEKATFNNTCEKFTKDVKTLLDYREKAQIDFDDFFNPIEFLIGIVSKPEIDTAKKFIVKKSRIKYIISFSIIFILLLFPSIVLKMEGSSIKDSAILTIISIVLFSDVFILLILFGSDHFRNKTILEINNKGLLINGEFKSWNDYVGFKTIKEEIKRTRYKSYIYKIHFETVGAISKNEIIMDNLSVTKTKFLNALKEYQRKFA